MNSAFCTPLLYIIKVFSLHMRPTVSRIIHFHIIYYSSPFVVMVGTALLLLSPSLKPRRWLLLPKPSSFQTEMKGRHYCALFLKVLPYRKKKIEYLFPSHEIIYVYVCVSVTVTESDMLFLKIGHKLNTTALQTA